METSVQLTSFHCLFLCDGFHDSRKSFSMKTFYIKVLGVIQEPCTLGEMATGTDGMRGRCVFYWCFGRKALTCSPAGAI